MSQEKTRELMQFYTEHSDQEFVKKVLDALNCNELTDDEMSLIGEWIASMAHGQPVKREEAISSTM